jgi:HEAT repeat protein/beta-lactamase regulating signal transducer with metallopeptidase domain
VEAPAVARENGHRHASSSVAAPAPAITAPARTARIFPALDGREVASLAWLAGALMVGVPVLVGAARVWWVARKTSPLESPAWSALAREIASDLDLARPVRLLRGGRETMPMAWGLVRPAVLLPEDAEHWPEAQRRAVLTHELAHVKRHDCLTQTLAHAACALYWFHPLVWVAGRRLRAERERACDDLVLRSGANGPDYADHLLRLARGFSVTRQASWTTVAMARPSELEGRLLAILDPSLDRRGPSRVGAFTTIGVAGLVVLSLAGLQPWARPALAARALDALELEAQAAAGERAATATKQREAADPRTATRTQTEVDGGALLAARAELQAEGEGQGEASDEAEATQTEAPSAKSANQDRLVSALAGALRDSDGEVRREAVSALGQIRAASAAGALAQALTDSDDEVRAKAAFALGELRSSAAVEPLGKALTADADPEVRQQAAFALGQIRAQASVAPLVTALGDKEAEVRQQAAFALGQIRAAEGVEGLTAALRDSSAEVRQQAVFALGQIRDRRAVPGLGTALQDKDAEVRQQAAFALGQLRVAEAAPALTQALKDSETEVRQQAVFALGQIRSRDAVPALISMLQDASAEVRQQAAFALGELRDGRASEALATALKDPEAEVRKQAAFALGQLE